ncbi:MAG: hypothetical protein WC989_05455 [Micavibrio sp.]
MSSHKTSYGRSISWGKRLILALLLLLAAGYGVLVMAARFKEPMRQGFQDYLESVTGEMAEITDVTTVKIVPAAVFTMEGVLIRDKETRERSLLKARRVSISLPFWGLITGTRKYYGFELTGLEVASGFFLPKKLTLDFAGITPPDIPMGQAYFVMDGQYNRHPLLVTAEMLVNSRGKIPVYSFRDTFPISFKLGKVEIEGLYARGWKGIAIHNGRLGNGLGGVLDFAVSEFQKSPLSARITGSSSEIDFDGVLKQEDGRILILLNPADEAGDEAIKTLQDFIDPVLRTMGLDGEDAPVIVRIEK